MQGRIIKGVAGEYCVDSGDKGIFTCKARGRFRKDKITPLVGDICEFEVSDEAEREGNIIDILPRKNSLIRPAAANVDQAVVVFAAVKPEPNFNLLDRFLVMMQKQNIHTVICFNKIDIAQDQRLELLKNTYLRCGHEVLFMSVKEKEGTELLKELLKNKISVLAGPSGVGKSSLMNLLAPSAGMEVGDLSVKIDRGKQTTRHTELIKIEENTYLCDTPGFTSLYVTDIDKEELREYFVEFDDYSSDCRFISCRHINEPNCGVRTAVSSGAVSSIRYENYCAMYRELDEQSKHKVRR